jgi:hypothetical protein
MVILGEFAIKAFYKPTDIVTPVLTWIVSICNLNFSQEIGI